MKRQEENIATGWKAPMKIERLRIGVRGSAYLGAAGKKSLSPTEAISVNDFCEIRDYRTFEKFMAKYGPPMFERYFDSKYQDGSYEHLTSMFSGKADDDYLLETWGQLEKPIKKWQGELQALMKAKVENPAKFKRLIKPYLRMFTKKDVMKQDGTLIEVRHYEGILEQCAYKIDTTRLPIKTCERDGCDRRFIKIKDTKKYCSRYCRYRAGRKEGLEEKLRAALFSRLHGAPEEVLPKTARAEAREEIKKATGLDELHEVETRYHLEPRKRGPKKGGGK